jgi:hypothetical protein
MTNEQFIDKLRLYEEYQLRSKGVQVTGEPVPRQGSSFIYTNRDQVSQSWLRKFERFDKWLFCLTTARILAANQERR